MVRRVRSCNIHLGPTGVLQRHSRYRQCTSVDLYAGLEEEYGPILWPMKEAGRLAGYPAEVLVEHLRDEAAAPTPKVTINGMDW